MGINSPSDRGVIILITVGLFVLAGKTHESKSGIVQLLRYLAILIGIVNLFFLLITCNSTDWP